MKSPILPPLSVTPNYSDVVRYQRPQPEVLVDFVPKTKKPGGLFLIPRPDPNPNYYTNFCYLTTSL